ncbi:FAD-binding oxidoreductase [Chloroflexota bacterium]
MKRWNGWGDDRTLYPLSNLAKEYLISILGKGISEADAPLDAVIRSVPASRLPYHASISIDSEDRLRHACGQSLPDWINLRAGRIPSFPDGVIYPDSFKEVRDTISFAENNNLILIPYGGGTSVLHHISPPDGDLPVLTIDLSQLNQLSDISKTNQLATFEAGIRGVEIERQLKKHGYTLGHYPQSFEYSTLGGWIATRSCGQQSYYYGRIEDLFKGGHIETPIGPLDIPPFPASAAGPDLRHLILGSEGRFGIITQATVAIKPIPEFEEFYGIFFKDWESGFLAVKEMAQKDILLSMMRLSDAQETETTMILSGKRNLIRWAGFGLDKFGYRNQRCLLIIGATGSRTQAARTRQAAIHVCRKHGGLFTGKFIGNTWRKSRFLAPYLRNSLWDSGYALDTLETAATWENVQLVKDKAVKAIVDANHRWNDQVLVFGHLSHVYPTGASIYITYLFRRSIDPDENLARWQEIKQAASQAIISNGGTISHQHGVGHDHASYVAAEKGQIGMDLLSNIGQFLDPNGLMNPGKMFNSKPEI